MNAIPGNAFGEARREMLQPAPLSDDEIEELYRQEALPPNQIFQLPAEEQEENEA